jgi:site-specific DNA-cytosine methylase
MEDKMKPIVFDLFCGLGGWSEAFIAEGYRAIGFDIEAHNYGHGGYPGELVLRDIRAISGAELVNTYGAPACIVASPPCQEYGYMAMPWSLAKEKRRKILADPAERERLTDLFYQCFRIQREVSAACGNHVPMVIENVRGAQEWVGRSKHNFGSFHLWGDVPALMPIPAKLKLKTVGPSSPTQTANHNCHINEMRDALKGEGNKTVGMNWSDQTKRGQDFTRIAGRQAIEGTKLPGNNSARRWEDREVNRLGDAPVEGGKAMNIHLAYAELKEQMEGVKGFTPNGEPMGKNAISRMCSSKSKKRKQASAEIAKIPRPLAEWLAKTWKPVTAR